VSDRETPAGWYPDTGDPSLLRWWDGERWTDRTRPLGSVDERWRTGEAAAATAETSGDDGTARPPGSGLRTFVLVLIFAAALGVAVLWLASALSDADGGTDELAAPGSDVVVYLCTGTTCPPATAEEVEALEAALADDSDAEEVAYVTEAEAWERFAELFADQPELVDEVEVGSLPASYEVWVREGVDPIVVALRYKELPGVDDAVVVVDR
jgi:hypothetical protein